MWLSCLNGISQLALQCSLFYFVFMTLYFRKRFCTWYWQCLMYNRKRDNLEIEKRKYRDIFKTFVILSDLMWVWMCSISFCKYIKIYYLFLSKIFKWIVETHCVSHSELFANNTQFSPLHNPQSTHVILHNPNSLCTDHASEDRRVR